MPWLSSLFLMAIVWSGCYSLAKKKVAIASTDPWYTQNFVYADGSNNQYVFNAKSFEYFPVTPEQSSTGTYSGGKYIKMTLQPIQFIELADAIRYAHADPACHGTDRAKMSSLISIQKDATISRFIIKPGHEKQQKIEDLLTKIKN